MLGRRVGDCRGHMGACGLSEKDGFHYEGKGEPRRSGAGTAAATGKGAQEK